MSPPSHSQTSGHSKNSSIDEAFSASEDYRISKSFSNDANLPFRSSIMQQETMDISEMSNGGVAGTNGLGNLADELADAFSDTGDELEDEHHQPNDAQEHQLDKNTQAEENDRHAGPNQDFADGISASTLSLPQQRGHQRKGSEYDGSEYGSESDLDAAGLTTSVITKIDAIESLARRGIENYGGPQDDVFKRVTDGLRDLASQSSVEGSASRLITAHSALATHLAHQTRQLHSLTFPLLSPLASPPNPDTVDDLIPLLVTLAEDLPKPSTVAYNSLSALHTMTAELIQTLSYLSDTLHMSRQTTVAATRRLKSAKELVAEMRREDELREEGERWLSRGNWGERLQKRECAGVCGEVIGGFEAVCNGWRERLLAQEESTA